MNELFKANAAKILACYSNADDIFEKGKAFAIGQKDKSGKNVKTADGWKPVKTHGHLASEEKTTTNNVQESTVIENKESSTKNDKQPLVKDVLGMYAPFFEIPPRCRDLNEVTYKAPYTTYSINCGANCSQYTLKTMFGSSVLDLFDKAPLSIYVEHGSIIFGARDSFKIGDKTKIVDNDNYNKTHDSGFEVKHIINSKSEWFDFLKKNGYQTHPPKAFSKPTGHIHGFHVYSIKGVIDNKKLLEQYKNK